MKVVVVISYYNSIMLNYPTIIPNTITQELKRYSRRHSAFCIGLYSYIWVGAMEFWADLAFELTRLKLHKLPYPIFRKIYML